MVPLSARHLLWDVLLSQGCGLSRASTSLVLWDDASCPAAWDVPAVRANSLWDVAAASVRHLGPEAALQP